MTEAEARARRMGWRPPDEWSEAGTKGKRRPSRFLTAEEYLDKCENDLPVLRERNRFLDGELAGSFARNAELDDLVIILHERCKALAARLREEERRRFLAEAGIDERPALAIKAMNGHSEAYDGLSEEEKADCDLFIRCVPGCTVEDYIEMYRPR